MSHGLPRSIGVVPEGRSCHHRNMSQTEAILAVAAELIAEHGSPEQRAAHAARMGVDRWNTQIGSLRIMGGVSGSRHPEWAAICLICGGTRFVRERWIASGKMIDCCSTDQLADRQADTCVPDDYWRGLISGAAARNIPFKIQPGFAWQLFQKQDGKCALTGWSIYFGVLGFGGQRIGKSASLDRIDSSKPYWKTNVQWVHKDVNRMKNNFPEERLLEMCQAIVEHAQV